MKDKLHSNYMRRVSIKLATYRVARRLLQISIGACTMFCVGSYEYSVFHFLGEKPRQPLVRSIDKLSAKQLGQFSVQKNAATETVFHHVVDPKQTRFPNEASFPWERCTTEIECFDWLLNDSHPAKMFVGVEVRLCFSRSSAPGS